MTSIRLFVLGACLCTMLAYSFFLQSCFVFLCFFRVFLKLFLVGLATDCAVVFYEWHCVLIDWLYCIDLFSCIAASLFNKLTYLLTYFIYLIARFGDRWDLVKESEVFIEYEAEVSSRVSGVEWGVADFGKLFTEISEKKFKLSLGGVHC